MLQVPATDVNVNDTLTYTIVTGTTAFAIDSTGKITATKKLDREVGMGGTLICYKFQCRRLCYAGYFQLSVHS